MSETETPLTREDLKGMEPSEINRRWPEVARVLSGEPASLVDASWKHLERAILDGRVTEVSTELERRVAAVDAKQRAEREEAAARHAEWEAEQQAPRRSSTHPGLSPIDGGHYDPPNVGR